MIEGITILNKVPIYGLPLWVSFVLIGGFTALVGWGVYCQVKNKSMVTIAAVGAVWIIACWVAAWLDAEVVTTGKYQYECLIDESAPYAEIIEHYDIVERRGAIWVLEEKGDK